MDDNDLDLIRFLIADPFITVDEARVLSAVVRDDPDTDEPTPQPHSWRKEDTTVGLPSRANSTAP